MIDPVVSEALSNAVAESMRRALAELTELVAIPSRTDHSQTTSFTVDPGFVASRLPVRARVMLGILMGQPSPGAGSSRSTAASWV